MFKKLLIRLAMNQAKRAAKKEAGMYSPIIGVSKNAPPAVLALAVPLIVQFLRQHGIDISDADAMEIALWVLAGAGFLNNMFKNWVLPHIKK